MNEVEVTPVISAARCVCSTLGYQHPAWNAGYYPEDCPEEWRLAYFMNDFQAVYLPAENWSRTPGQLEAIAEELEDERFELVLEWPDQQHYSRLQLFLDSLSSVNGHISCIVLDMDALPAAVLGDICDALNHRFPLAFRSRSQNTRQRSFARQQAAGFVWTPAEASALVPGGAYQVVRLPCLELREIKPVIQQLRPLLERGIRAGVFLDTHARAPQRALEVRAMMELMGLA